MRRIIISPFYSCSNAKPIHEPIQATCAVNYIGKGNIPISALVLCLREVEHDKYDYFQVAILSAFRINVT